VKSILYKNFAIDSLLVSTAEWSYLNITWAVARNVLIAFAVMCMRPLCEFVQKLWRHRLCTPRPKLRNFHQPLVVVYAFKELSHPLGAVFLARCHSVTARQ